MIRIDKSASLALYKQIVEVVIAGIGAGQFIKQDKLPSVNEVAGLNMVSRDTVLLAYNELRERGIVKSIPGIGYFIERDFIEAELRIMLLFDELNAFKEDLYNAFIGQLKGRADVDIYFHHFNENLFEGLLRAHKKDYSAFVIMPANLKSAQEAIAQLP
ncbi:MAG: GntR family transcriptional regulator, partial [Bacteroidales bacterium]|nr:GntR family transcriptional regulator [Bacteroidales bacterium]